MDFKFNNDLFVGRQELEHFQKSIKSKGYIESLSQLIRDYGIVKMPTLDPTFQYLRAIQGTAVDKVTIKAGYAIDSNINTIAVESDLIDHLTSPTDGLTRYVIIKYADKTIEEGTISVDANGTLTGTGTLFEEKLRGLPNFPAKISFPGSAGNTGEYIVESVTDDLTAQLNIAAGIMVPESGLQYKVVGTFTPGIAVPAGSKYPFISSGYEIRLDTSSVIVAGEEFILGTYATNGVVSIVTDLRESYILALNPTQTDKASTTNPLIGVESVQHHYPFDNNDTNKIKVGWGLRVASGSWTYDAVLNQITVSAGSGGIWDTIASHVNGDLDGWEVHFQSGGKKVGVVTSTNSAPNVVLQLEPVGTVPSGDIVVNPLATQIELIGSIATVPNAEKIEVHDIAAGYGYINMLAHTGSVKLEWRHINLGRSNGVQDINDGDYLNETSFDTSGNQIATNLSAVAAATLVLLDYVDNFYEAKAWRTKTNIYTATQQFNMGAGFAYDPADNTIGISLTGNTFELTINNGDAYYMVDMNPGTTINIKLVAGTTNRLKFYNTGGPASVLGSSRFSVQETGTLGYASYVAGDLLTFVRSNTPGNALWHLVAAQSSANALAVTNAINETLEDAWTDLPAVLTETYQNDQNDGSGTDIQLNGALGTQAPQAGSYMRYKQIGKTVHVSLILLDIITTDFTTSNVASIVIKGLLPAPLNNFSGHYKAECPSNSDALSGTQSMEMSVGSGDVVFNLAGLTSSNASFNRLYVFSSTTSIILTASASVSHNPRYRIYTTFTYETS